MGAYEAVDKTKQRNSISEFLKRDTVSFEPRAKPLANGNHDIKFDENGKWVK